MTGIEYSQETVANVKNFWPELKVNQGDVLSLDYPDEYFSGIISIGVVEHFIEGPDEPLKEMCRVLKKGGKALITVPSFNYLRRMKMPIRWVTNNLRRNSLIRKICGKKPLVNNKWHCRGSIFKYRTYPEYGEFYEYRMTQNEFREALIRSGFSIIEDVPLYYDDGLFHEFGRLFAIHNQWKFTIYPHGKLLNWLLSKIPFFAEHFLILF